MHPADIADRAAIATATEFVATLFLGSGVFARAEADSLQDARNAAMALAAAHPESSRQPMVYAVVGGKSVFVPVDFDPANPTPPKAFGKRFNAQRAARSALGDPVAVDGVDFRTVKIGDGYIWEPIAPAAADSDTDVKRHDPSFLALHSSRLITNDPTDGYVATEPGSEPMPRKTSKTKASPKAAKPTKAETARPLGKRAQIEEAARNGKLPPVPDFSAETHARFRGKLAEVVALVKAGDVRGLKAFKINPISTSPKAIDRYRNLAIIALQARS